MASRGSGVKLKESGALSSQQQPVFKLFIIKFVQSLRKDDRKAFKYWCKDLIPRVELNKLTDVEDDGNIFKLIELLQDYDQLSFNDMSLLKKFLPGANRMDLLTVLEKAELSIVISMILEHYKVFSNGSDHYTADKFNYADVVEFLVSTRDKSSKVLEHVRGIGDDMLFLDVVVDEYLLNPECTWSIVTALLVILAELSAEADKDDFQAIIELLAGTIHKLGGMKKFKLFVKEKLNLERCDSATVKECLEIIAHQVDK